MTEDDTLKGRATAIKDGKGWKVTFDEEFLAELKYMPQAAQDEVRELVEGIADGSIDPTIMGKRMCGYCGIELKDAPVGDRSCENCLKELA
jgi:hypothetical protein